MWQITLTCPGAPRGARPPTCAAAAGSDGAALPAVWGGPAQCFYRNSFFGHAAEKFLSKLNQRTFESGMGVGAPRGMVEGPGRALDGGE